MTARRAAKRSGKRAATASPAKKSTGRRSAGKGASPKRSAAKRPAPSKRSTNERATARLAAKPRAATTVQHDPARLVELVERYLDAFNRADLESVLALYHPRATMEDPVGYSPARGHRAIGEVYRGGFRQGVTIVPDGAVRCTGRAVAFPVIARTATATLQSVNVFEVDGDGRIESMRAYWGPYNVVGTISVRG